MNPLLNTMRTMWRYQKQVNDFWVNYQKRTEIIKKMGVRNFIKSNVGK